MLLCCKGKELERAGEPEWLSCPVLSWRISVSSHGAVAPLQTQKKGLFT